MSDDRGRLKEEIRQMAEELDGWRSVAPRVMREVRRRAAQHERVAGAGRRLGWVARPVVRYVAALGGAVVLFAAFAIWFRPVGMGTSIAFADVQQAIRRIETAIVVSEHPERPFWNHRILYRRDSDLVRKEWQNGVVYINDGRGKQLALNPRDKTAQLCVGNYSDSSSRDYLDDLANVQHDSIHELGERTFDGQTLVGFALKPHGALAHLGLLTREIWVDPKTRLPVREECIATDPDDLVSAIWRSTTFYTFNEPVDESLFQMTPPEGYTTLEGHHWHRTMSPPVAELPDDPNLASPEIDPQRGIGPARFGMTAKEVVRVLGRPDEMNYGLEFSPEDKRRYEKMRDELFKKTSQEVKEKNLDAFGEDRLRQEMIKKLNSEFRPTGVSGVHIDYQARGFSLIVDQEKGLRAIFCLAGNNAIGDFTGKTSKGIGMGSTLAETEKAYGPADMKHEDPDRNEASLYYKSLCLLLHFKDDRLYDLSINLADKDGD